jgi:hypothetical protein
MYVISGVHLLAVAGFFFYAYPSYGLAGAIGALILKEMILFIFQLFVYLIRFVFPATVRI